MSSSSQSQKDMSEPAGGAIAWKGGAKLIQRLAPKGIEKIKTWWRGKKILLVGQPKSGKTTFANYLEYGLFEPETDNPNKTLKLEERSSVTVSMGRDGSLELRVKRLTDTAGQHGPTRHAQIAYDREPHCLVVMTDATQPLEHSDERVGAGSWLEEFCDRFERLWRADDIHRNPLKHMVIVVNKYDKVDDEEISDKITSLRDIVDEKLELSLGKMENKVPILKCICVKNPKGTEFIDMVLSNMARGLK